MAGGEDQTEEVVARAIVKRRLNRCLNRRRRSILPGLQFDAQFLVGLPESRRRGSLARLQAAAGEGDLAPVIGEAVRASCEQQVASAGSGDDGDQDRRRGLAGRRICPGGISRKVSTEAAP